MQEPVPEQTPDQPVKVEPIAGFAVRTTLVSEAYTAEQVDPHRMPAGTESMVPIPVPTLLTLREYLMARGLDSSQLALLSSGM